MSVKQHDGLTDKYMQSKINSSVIFDSRKWLSKRKYFQVTIQGSFGL